MIKSPVRIGFVATLLATTIGCAYVAPTFNPADMRGPSSVSAPGGVGSRPTRVYAVDLSSAAGTDLPVSSDRPNPGLSAQQLLAAYQTCQAATDRPTQLSDLTGGSDNFYAYYQESLAVSLGVIGAGDATGSKKASVARYYHYRFVRRNCTINKVVIPVIWGVGVASTLHIKDLKKGAKTSNGLPGIAASVEFGQASVTMRMRAEGLVGAPIEAAFPSASSLLNFDVEAYSAWAIALDKIRGLISATGVTATPQLLFTDEALAAIQLAYSTQT
jgi:hypothetical protein